ncbi:MAG: glycosyltransferase family 4 protein [Candidatus Rokubacteria bacterium]|nr:glycosyltransferase family 4 protein [Candidatus Rokubacteria bacterium]
MRITILCPHLRIAGGVRAILTYADRLGRGGHAVTLIVPAPRGRRSWWGRRPAVGAARAPAGTDPPAQTDPPPRIGPPPWMPELRARITRTDGWRGEALPDGDAVLATSWQSADAVAAAPARCGRKLYLIQHYESLYHGDPARVDATYRLPLRQIVISSWLADIMRERFASAAEVIVTPVDPALFHPVAVDPAAESEPGAVRVLMLHHDYAWKGVADGLEAVAAARARHPELRLAAFGVKPPPRRAPYDEYFTDLPQGRLAWLYSRAAVYLCPSWDEGLGMPPMEAMACGAALCTYDTGGSRDYAIDGETALVAPRRDVGALGRALERLVADAGLRQRLAARGRELVTTRFDWARATRRMEELLAGAP